MVQFLAFYDNDQFCGMSYLFEDAEQTYILYLAVASSLRSGGYGSKILRWIETNSPSKNVSLNIEEVDEHFENYSQRVKRFKFYQKNSYRDTGMKIILMKDRYPILSNCTNFSKEKYQHILRKATFGLYKPTFA
jgi:GNAT superfamily N-acetyltransferase